MQPHKISETNGAEPMKYRFLNADVNRTEEHFELRYCGINHASWDECIRVALIGRSHSDPVIVEYLIDIGDVKNAEMVLRIEKEIQFYFFELNEQDPWAYAQYHCNTSSNLYSDVRWIFFPVGSEQKLPS
ncbi:MAG TPA: hypothetical protein VIJ79_17130 [Acidobacteriaceae bacterium]